MLREETDKYIRLRRRPLWAVLHCFSYQAEASSIFWLPPQKFQTPTSRTHSGVYRIHPPEKFWMAS